MGGVMAVLSQSGQNPEVSQHVRGNCQHEIYEADFMAAVKAVPIRKPAKQLPFGAMIGKFGKEDGVQKSKEDFLAHQGQKNVDGMQAATDTFYSLLRPSLYGREVCSEVAILIDETEKAPGPTNAITSTRLDFAAQGIWQVPCPERAEESTDSDAIEAMRASASVGGYRLFWLEALYRGRGEGNEEGVGTFIAPLLDLHTSDPDTWTAFKRHEFRWVYDNFNRQGLAMSVNLFPSDFLVDGIVGILGELHREDPAVFKLLHVELLEHEDANKPAIIEAILAVHRKTGLILAKDDVGPETFADPAKRQQLIELYRSLRGSLTVLKLDSSLVCGAMNVPLVPRCFDRDKAAYDAEVASKRRYREAWAAGMDDKLRKFPFPVKFIDADHFTQLSVVRTCDNQTEAVEHAADVVQGFVEVSQALGFEVDIVAEVSVYANDFQRQLEHPIFGPFTKALLMYAKRGKLFIQGSMGGGRAVSDAIVEHLVATPVQDSSGDMKALLVARQNSAFAGDDDSFHINEDFTVYEQFPEALKQVQLARENLAAGIGPRAGEA